MIETPPPPPQDETPRQIAVAWDDHADSRNPLAAWFSHWENSVGTIATLVGLAVLALLLLGDRTGTRDLVRAGLARPQSASASTQASFRPLTPSTVEVTTGSNVTLAVRALGAGGAPLADTVVLFRIESGAAVLSADAVRTNALGIAETSARIDGPGDVFVAAAIPGSDLPVLTYSLVSLTSPARRVAQEGGEGQEAPVATLLPEPVTLLVTDEEGNAVSDAEVLFESLAGGAVTPSRTRTDSLGRATARWRLGPEAGVQRLSAVVPSAGGEPITFTATATPVEREEPEPPPARQPEPERRPEPQPEPVRGAAPPTARPSTTVPTVSVALGGSHACVLSSGSATCRGANDRGQRGAPTTDDFVALASGVSHVCALDRTGTASCWGANQNGQLGDGSRADRNAPVRVATDMRFTRLAAGVAFTCGVTTGGRAACWGQNLNGQLGDGSRDDRRTPETVAGVGTFRTLAAGWNHACGVTSSSELYCWGLNGQGQIGDGTRLDRLVPTQVVGTFEDVAAGSSHTCGLSEGRVLCWGGNGFGQLGDGRTTNGSSPVAIRGLPAATQVTAGAAHTCALVSGGAAYCWGQNLYGQLGDGTTQNRTVPTPVAGNLRFSRIHAGGAVTCGITVDGRRHCWGLNQNGQLGDGTRENRTEPTGLTEAGGSGGPAASGGSRTSGSSSAPTRELKAAAQVRGERLLLQNADAFDWTNCRVTLNQSWNHRIDVIRAGETVPRALAVFAGDGGERFSAAARTARTISVSCDTPEGRGSWLHTFQ